MKIVISSILISLVFLVTGLAFGNNPPLFSISGKNVHYKDLPIGIKQRIFEAEKNRILQLEAIIDEHLLTSQISNKKQTLDEKKILVTEKEAKAWFEENKEKVGNRSFESIKDDLINYLSQKKSFDEKTAQLKDYKQNQKFKFHPEAQVTAPEFSIETTNYPSQGPVTPLVTLVEFADYQCPHCKHASSILKKIVEKHKKYLKFTYIDLPINPSGVSKKVAEGAYCAHKQNKFWEYHYAAFDEQVSLTDLSPQLLARKLKLNIAEFEKCLIGKEAKKQIERSLDLASKLGLSGTPTIFINGIKQLDYTKEALEETIKGHLQAAQKL